MYPSLHIAVYAAQAVPLLITDRNSQWQKRYGGLMLAALDYRLCVHGSAVDPDEAVRAAALQWSAAIRGATCRRPGGTAG
jgi:hypothetical protein